MNRKTTRLLISFVVLVLVAALSVLVFNQTKCMLNPPLHLVRIIMTSFTPTVWKPAWVDQDNNGIADTLDQEIADRTANGTAQDYVNVTVMLKAAPTTQDADDFVSSGGYLTTPLGQKPPTDSAA